MVEGVDPGAAAQAAKPTSVIARESAERRARRQTVRIRNTGCEGIATGSGFALDPQTLA